MKKLTIASLALIAAFVPSALGQVKSVTAANEQRSSKSAASNPNSANTTRVRVLGDDLKAISPSANLIRSDYNNHPETARLRRTGSGQPPASAKPSAANSSVKMSAGAPANSPVIAASATQVYRVGPRDVLDIQLVDNPGRKSTLFTVLEGGVLEYPLAGNPITVAGMTTAEIADVLRQRIKILENPKVEVSVRDYASHTVNVTGFVAAPGRKALRREAVPLYTMLAEALVLPEAARATLTRAGRAPIVLDLKDSIHTSTLVIAGDSIKVSGMPAGPTAYFFVGGEIKSPGQKAFHSGLTLTQAIMASGGTTATAGTRIKVSRQGDNGLLISEEHNLRKIQDGKVADPVLQKGDRIEVFPGD